MCHPMKKEKKTIAKKITIPMTQVIPVVRICDHLRTDHLSGSFGFEKMSQASPSSRIFGHLGGSFIGRV